MKVLNPNEWSKKLTVTLAILFCSTALAWKGALTIEQWLDLTKLIGSAYLGIQGIEDWLKKPKGK